MKVLFISLLVLTSTIAISQERNVPTIDDALKKYDFIQGQVINENDTITFYLKNYTVKPKNLVVFIQGTDANPVFSYKMKNGKPIFYRWLPNDYKFLDSTYTYAIIPKPGMAGLYQEEKITIPVEYYKKNYQEYRVNQVSKSIDDIIKNHLGKPEKVIVYGHSEGAAIGSSLALINKQITHLGFWSGNVLNNFYEFTLFNRIESLKGQLSDSLAHQNIMGIIKWYESVIENPNSTDIDHFGFTNKRWATYEKPPIEDLLALDIPIYTVFATEDESTPIETAYLLPIQFMEKRKKNLTFEVCISCDHSYIEKNGESKIYHWDDIFKKFIEWTEKKSITNYPYKN